MENKRLIFLDIDGVLNCKPWLDHMDDEGKHELINPEYVRRLACIVRATNAKIVLCSTWKNLRDAGPDEPEVHAQWLHLVQSLASQGLSLTDCTTDEPMTRPRQVSEYLERNHYMDCPYIILDDDFTEEDYAKEGIPGHLVQTRYWCETENEGGIQDMHVQQAIGLLLRQKKRSNEP